VIRRILTLLALFVWVLSARAEQAANLVITADQPSYDQATNEGVYTGHVEARQGDLLITADEIRARQDATAEEIKITGHVVYTRGGLRILADRIVLNRRDGSFSADRVRLGSYPYFIEGLSAKGTRNEVTVLDARVAYGEPGPWQPTISATKVIVSPGNHVRFEGGQVGIGHIRPLPFPQLQQSLSDPLLAFVTVTGGYRSSLGAYVDGGIHLPVLPGVRLGGDVGYYTARGLLIGPSGTYANPSDPAQLHGFFRSGYINDHGDKKTDVLGRPVPENRGFVEWEHQQVMGDALSLKAQLNWWRDSEVVRDFRPRLFFPVQQPDTFVEATYAGANTFVSAFGRFEPNDFEIVQQRTPEIRLDVLPTSIGGGVLERFNGSIAMLREKPVFGAPAGALAPFAVFGVTQPSPFPTPILPGPIPGPIDPPPPVPGGGAGSTSTSSATAATIAAPAAVATTSTTPPAPGYTGSTAFPAGATHELRSTRIDAYYGLMRPITQGDWLTVTPVAGTRFTHYMNTVGAAQDGGYTRLLGEVGADAELRTSGTFAYKNEAWKIDGLRHLFTPKISYRYIPEADKGSRYIPAIDRAAFSTYLQPLGLGDVRNIDELHATNTLRLALDNTLQTRDPQYGARDLLTFNVANDFLFKRQPGQRDVSAIHTELAAMPTRWLELGFYNSFAPQSFTLREFNTGVTIHDGNAWSVLFANNYLRQQLEDYLIDGRRRLTEQFDVLARLRYDQRKHRFNEQSYGLVQNLANTWRVSYLVSLYSGPRRESHFGFSIQIDTVRF
jgi:lipopolysaccharide export system protein LptA